MKQEDAMSLAWHRVHTLEHRMGLEPTKKSTLEVWCIAILLTDALKYLKPHDFSANLALKGLEPEVRFERTVWNSYLQSRHFRPLSHSGILKSSLPKFRTYEESNLEPMIRNHLLYPFNYRCIKYHVSMPVMILFIIFFLMIFSIPGLTWYTSFSMMLLT